MRVTLYGTRGSIPAPGPETMRYGGNTPAVHVCAENGAVLVLDAGTGIRRLGAQLSAATTRVDILLTHLHMDHIQGLGFFSPLYNPASRFTSGDLRAALSRWRPAYRAISPHLYFQYTFAICREYRVITSHAPASILARFVY
jgi:phosphoribosyl 1,2-cyclic phosphodiesterase